MQLGPDGNIGHNHADNPGGQYPSVQRKLDNAPVGRIRTDAQLSGGAFNHSRGNFGIDGIAEDGVARHFVQGERRVDFQIPGQRAHQGRGVGDALEQQHGGFPGGDFQRRRGRAGRQVGHHRVVHSLLGQFFLQLDQMVQALQFPGQAALVSGS